MDVRGLVLVGNENEMDAGEQLPFSGPPLSLLDVAGYNPLLRTIRRLETYGISPVTAVVEETFPSLTRPPAFPEKLDYRVASPERFWRVAENAFNDLSSSGADLVVLIRMGAYAEIDFDKLLQFHLDRRCRVTRVIHEASTLDMFCITASRRNDAASLFRSRLSRCRSDCEYYVHQGYINHLANVRDLRQMAIDVLTLKTETPTAGREVRPGIWVERGACIEKGARLLAPCFVGVGARVRDGAVLTRCTTVEHHAQVDCGTVIENCTVLPQTSIGAGLDLSHSLVGIGQIAHLRRDVVVEVADPKLLGRVPPALAVRLAGAAMQFWRGLVGAREEREPALGHGLGSTASELLSGPACAADTSAELAPNLVIARRYGDQ